jgi:hypothetical protein
MPERWNRSRTARRSTAASPCQTSIDSGTERRKQIFVYAPSLTSTASTKSSARLPHCGAAPAIQKFPKAPTKTATSPCRRQLNSHFLQAHDDKVAFCAVDHARACALRARSTPTISVKRKLSAVFSGILRALAATASTPEGSRASATARISRSHLAVWSRLRQEPVSTSAENALWCRDFAAGKVILSIDIKGLAERYGLWRVA